jgi:O-antigen/teichoic acid export membrane protein
MKQSLAFVYVAFAFRYVYPLVLVPFLARTLGVDEYGRLLAATSITMLVWATVDFGFPICGARDAASAKDSRELGRIFGRQIAGRLITVVPAMLLGLGATLTSPVLRERPMFGILATLGGITASTNLGWYFQGTLRFVTSVVLEILATVMALPTLLYLVRDEGDGVTVLWINLLSGAVVSVLSYALALRGLDRSALRITGGWTLLREATPLFAHRGFGMILQSGAIYVASLFATAQGVGIYGSAEKLVGLGVSAMTPAGQVLLGTITRRHAEGAPGVFLLVRKAIAAMFLFSLVGATLGVLLSDVLIPVVLGPGFEDAVPVVQTLGWVLPFSALNLAMGTYVLVPLRMDRVVSVSSLVNLAVALPLMLLLAAPLGLHGLAVSRIVGEASVTVFLATMLQRKRLWRALLDGVAPEQMQHS